MSDRRLCLVIVLAGLCLVLGCEFPTTVYGRLVLKPGEDGDVRLAHVELRDSAAWDSAPVYTQAPGPGGQFYRVSFDFPAVVPGSYFLLAWQDRDTSGQVSDGDLVGVYGTTYAPGSPGKPVTVYKGWTVDVADIELSTCAILDVAATGSRSESGDTTAFTYTFNHDAVLNSLLIAFPGQSPLPDAGAPGPKVEDSTYSSGGWSTGGPMPTGLHQLEFRGTFKDSAFDFRVAVFVR